MANCPSCGAPIEQDFGMVTCHQCNAVLMVNINGDVVMGSSSPGGDDAENRGDPLVDQPSEVGSEGWDAPLIEDSGDNEPEGESPVNFSSFDELSEPQEEGAFDNDFFESDSLAEAPESDLETPGAEAALATAVDEEASDFGNPQRASELSSESNDEDSQANWAESSFEDSEEGAETMEHPAHGEVLEREAEAENFSAEGEALDSVEDEAATEPDPLFAMSSEPDPEPVDITEFANSEASSLEEGEYLYELKISGLDSKDLRDTLKAILMDEKLKLNYLAILKKVKQGRVQIDDLNPVKAKRIIEQLQFFDIKVSWRQVRVVLEEPVGDIEAGEAEGELTHDA